MFKVEPNFNTFRIVHSTLYSYLFLPLFVKNKILEVISILINYAQEFIDVYVTEHLRSINPDFRIRIDVLENCTLLNRQYFEFIRQVVSKLKYSKLFIDSGGLQLFKMKTGAIKNKKEDKEMFFEKYIPLQAYGDVAIALDDIPLNQEEVVDCARSTSENIIRQIDIFKNEGRIPVLLPVLSPLLIPEAIDVWADLLFSNLNFNYHSCICNGFAFGGVAQAFTKKIQFNIYLMKYYIAQMFRFAEKYKACTSTSDILVHFLGLLDTRRVDILACVPLLKKVKSLSLDGRTISVIYIYGNMPYITGSGELIYRSCNGTCSIFVDGLRNVLLFFYEVIFDDLKLFKSIEEFIRNAIEYFSNNRTDKTCIAHRTGILTTCLLATIFKVVNIVEDIKKNIDTYSKIIEDIQQDYDKIIAGTRPFLTYSSPVSSKINIDELL